MAELSIRQVSQRSGLSIDTLRFYEKQGLVAPLRDAHSRHRRCLETDLEWLNFVCKLRQTGMPLLEIRRYIELHLQGEATLGQRRAMMAAQADRVEARIAELQAALEVVRRKQRKQSFYCEAEAQRAREENS